jgi:hypothetical protein
MELDYLDYFYDVLVCLNDRKIVQGPTDIIFRMVPLNLAPED